MTKQLLLHGLQGAVICGRRQNFLELSSKLLERETLKKCKWFVRDVRDAQSCQKAVQFALQEFGRLDILVNGAAGNFLSPARSLKPKGFATVMSIDALGTFNMCSAAFDALAQQGKDIGDAIIINSSATLQCPATHYQVHASAAKAAVDSLTRSLALEWGQYHIHVVGIAPGPIRDTPGTTKLAPNPSGNHHDLHQKMMQGIPLGRMGTATEIGDAAVFRCTSKYTTGDVLIVDGGEWLYKPPLIAQESVEQLSRAVEQKSRSQAPSSVSTSSVPRSTL